MPSKYDFTTGSGNPELKHWSKFPLFLLKKPNFTPYFKDL